MANYDEEYHFSESEAETPVSSSSHTEVTNQSTTDKDFQSRRKGRNIILFLATLITTWAIYKFMAIFLSQMKQTPHKPLTVIQHPITPLKPQSIPQSIQPVKPIQPALSAAQIQEISNQKERLNKLEAQVINVQTTLSDTNTKLNDLSSQMNNLASQANKPPPLVKEIKKKPVHIKKHLLVKKHKPYISYSYQLEAAIPGRAWIMRSDGTNLTVSVGDRISGYGTVISIDPTEGVVQMNSGANIKYSSH